MTTGGERRLTPMTGLGLVVALVVPVALTLIALLRGGAGVTVSYAEFGLVLHWSILALLLAIVVYGERRPLSSIGVRRLTLWTVPLGLAAGIVLTAASPLIAALGSVLSIPRGDSGMAQALFALPLILRVALAVTAGIYEETLFRGYAIERLTALTGSKWLAGAVSVVAFTLAHWSYWGLAQLFPIAIVGTLVTLLYLWRRNLVLNIIAHATTDAIGLVLVPLLHPGA
jgi:membrane protease YdiL (CAAX protease family)